MRTAVAVLAVVLGCTAALAQDLSTNFKVRAYGCGDVQRARPFCNAQPANCSAVLSCIVADMLSCLWPTSGFESTLGCT